MIVTDHARKRMKKRCGLKKKTIDRIASKALLEGTSHSETSGRLNKWITSLYFYDKTANNIKLYGDKAFIFHNSVLITVIQIPNNLMPYKKYNNEQM